MPEKIEQILDRISGWGYDYASVENQKYIVGIREETVNHEEDEESNYRIITSMSSAFWLSWDHENMKIEYFEGQLWREKYFTEFEVLCRYIESNLIVKKK